MDTATNPETNTGATKRRFRIPIAAALVGGVALLLIVTVGSVLAISQFSAQRITLELLGDNADVGLELLESRVRGQLEPAHVLGLRLAQMLADGTINPGNRQQLEDTFRGALAAVPQATALIFIDETYRSYQYPPNVGSLDEVVAESLFTAGLQGMLDSHDGMEQMLTGARDMEADFVWMAPIWVQSLKQPVLFLEVPVGRGESFSGVVLVVVALGELSQFLKELESRDATRAFVLYEGDKVLAHPALFDMMLSAGSENEVPLPSLTMFSDPALAFRLEGKRAILDIGAINHRYTDAYELGEDLVIVSELSDFGPWEIGLKLRRSVLDEELARIRKVALVGLTILAIAVALGLMLGRVLTRQIGGLAEVANALATLDVDRVERLPDSRFRELDNAAHAFNAMTTAMRWFETYVPKTLVLRLRRDGESVTKSQDRVLTIMFTDIRGFSTLAEHRPAAEIAQMLNQHFEMLTRCIEAQGGTVDKFIGDSVMAFWGAPETITDHAERAMLAARAISQAVQEDSARRRSAGEPIIAVRIGLHTGPAVVGNIGPRSRVNYTVVGDTVNTAARLEALAKEVAPDDDCVVLVSAETAAAAPEEITLKSLGARSIRGREGTVEVYRLLA
ncbi:MAG: adenylate/guanylate cyclase domain-containing protein [Alphaproteobacteria bacterium]